VLLPRVSVHAALLAASAVVTAVAVSVAALGVPSHADADRPEVSVRPFAQAPADVLPVPASRTRPAATHPAVLAVSPLRRTLVPDLVVTAKHPLSAAQRLALKKVTGVTGSTVLGTALLHVGKVPVHAVSVDPSEFRAFTPRETGGSNALWAAVARGDLAADYGVKLPLGKTFLVQGANRVTGRVGAVAAFGVPGTNLVVNRLVGRQLGLAENTALVTAPERGLSSLKRDVRRVLGADADISVLRPVAITYRRPATYRALYMLSAQYCPGLSWKVLASIGQIESGHGVNVGPSSAGALGPMQFLPSTWAFSGVDGDGDGKADIMSAFDAVPAAALYLCRNGAGRGGQSLYNAIFSYNHADWYVREVLALAEQYK
jgi:hypothetical protein